MMEEEEEGKAFWELDSATTRCPCRFRRSFCRRRGGGGFEYHLMPQFTVCTSQRVGTSGDLAALEQHAGTQ